MGIAKQDLDKILNQARIKLTGASDAGIKSELYDVLTEFFDISSSWQEDIALDALANQTHYDLVPDSGQIIRLGGTVGNVNFANTTSLETAEAASGGTVRGWIFQPSVMPAPGQLILINPPSNPQAMRVTVIKNVDLPTTRDLVPIVPEWTLQKYGRYILDGILGKMMGTPQKSYSNDVHSIYHLKRFQEGIARARVATLKGNTYGAQAWQFPGSFRTRSQHGFVSTAGTRGF